MKQLHLILLCSVLLLFSSCTKEKETILVKFINETGQPVINAKAADQLVGNIAANSATGFIEFSSFGTDTGMPDITFTGRINGAQLESTSRFYWCGTEKSGLPPGKYAIEIHTVNAGGVDYFHLRFQ